MPNVIVKFWPGKSAQQKQQLADAITRADGSLSPGKKLAHRTGKHDRLTVLILIAIAAMSPNWRASGQVTPLERSNHMKIKIGSKTFVATLEDSATAKAFKALLPLRAEMSELNGNEKSFQLPKKLPTNAFNPGTIHNGDLMLYGSDTFVLFYKTFSTSYSYTRLGRVNDPGALASAAGLGNVKVIIEGE